MNAVRYNKSYLFSYITAICLGSFQYGYNFTNFVFLGNMKTKDFASTQFLHLYVAGISIATGALVGSFIGGYFAHRSRRMIIVVSCLLNIVGAFITIVIFNEYALCIGNFIQGLSTGTFTMIIPNFIKELSPCHIAGFAIGFNEFYSIAGIFVALIFCSLYMIYVEVIWWRIIWGFPIAVALLQLFLLLFIFPLDTPRYYYFDGDKKMAAKALRKVFIDHEDIANRIKELRDLHQKLEGKKILPWKAILSITYKRAFIIGTMTSLLKPLSGLYIFSIYFNYITKNIVTNSEIRAFIIMGLGLTMLTSCLFIQYFLIDRRKKIMIIGGILNVIVLIGHAALDFMKIEIAVWHISFLFGVFISVSFISFSWVYMAEILRVKTIAIANTITWFITLVTISAFYFPNVGQTDTLWKIAVFFVVLAVLIILLLIFLIRNASETMGKNELEIRYLFVEKKKYIVFNPSFLESIRIDRLSAEQFITDGKLVANNDDDDSSLSSDSSFEESMSFDNTLRFPIKGSINYPRSTKNNKESSLHLIYSEESQTIYDNHDLDI